MALEGTRRTKFVLKNEITENFLTFDPKKGKNLTISDVDRFTIVRCTHRCVTIVTVSATLAIGAFGVVLAFLENLPRKSEIDHHSKALCRRSYIADATASALVRVFVAETAAALSRCLVI